MPVDARALSTHELSQKIEEAEKAFQLASTMAAFVTNDLSRRTLEEEQRLQNASRQRQELEQLKRELEARNRK